MKIFNKALCLLLCIAMVFSCAAPCSALSLWGDNDAEETTDFYHSIKYHTQQSDLNNVSNVLDEVDKLLKEKNYSISYKVVLTEIKIDFSSIDSICETFDFFKSILTNPATVVVKKALGDIGDLNVSSWQTGLKRGSQDITIVKEFLELLFNNKEIIEKFCSGEFDAGALNGVLNIEKLVGKDGVSGIVKKWIIGLVYEKDSDAYNNAYNTYKNNFDAFIYGDLLNTYADKFLPGFVMNENSTVESLICVAFGLVVDKYIKPLISEISIDTKNSEYEALRALDGLVNLDGSTYDFSGIRFDSSKSFLSQVNGVVGEIFTQLIPGYKWQSGNYDKISENIEGAFKYLGKESGLIPDADSLTFDEIVMQVIAILVKNVDLQGIGDGVTECETLEDMVKVALINITGNLGLGTTYKAADSYLLVLGDIAAHYLYNNFDVKDLSGKTLVPGMGYDVFQVANFALNYLLFDRNLGSFLGFSTTQSTDVFTKIDKLLDYFGETKSKGVNFDSKKFILGDAQNKGILDAFFDLEIEYILDITAVPALKNAGNVSAVKFIYNSLRYFLNNWSGKNMIPAYTTGAFNNALKNENVAKMAEYLIETLYNRNTSFIRAAALVGAVLFKGEDISLGKVTAKVEDTVYSGGVVSPKATVSLGSKSLTQYTDFVVVCTDAKVGQSKAVIKGIGIYKGKSEEVTFNMSLGQMKNLKATLNGDTVRLSWQAIEGAVKYTVVSASHNTETTESFIELPVEKGEQYTFTVTAVTADGVKSAPATVTAKAEQPKITDLKSTVNGNTVKLSWKAVSGAVKYTVVSSSHNKETTVNSIEIPVEFNKQYTFTVTAIMSDGAESESASVSVKAQAEKVKGLKASKITYKSLTLSWTAVTGADKYNVQIYDSASAEWEDVSSPSKTSVSVTSGLSAGTTHKFRVCAVYGTAKGTYSDTLSVTLKPGKVKNLDVDTVTDKKVVLSWDKVKNAKGYEVCRVDGDGDIVVLKKVTTTTATITGLTSCESYEFKVRAYLSDGTYGDYSSGIATATLPPKVTGLKTESTAETSVKISWKDIPEADKYIVEIYKSGKWERYSTTTATSVTVKSLSAASTYKFRVKAYNAELKVYSEYSSTLTAKTRVAQVKKLKASQTKTTSVKLTWDKVKGAEGYVAYYSTDNKTWKKIDSTTKTNITKKSLKSKKTYYFRVRAFRKTDGKEVYGSYSTVLKVKTK